MKTIKIEIPEGKKAIKVEQDGSIIITFKDKPKDYSKMETFDEFYEAASEDIRKEYDGDQVISKDAIAYKKLRLIAAVINTDMETGKRWIANWNDGNEKKWFPWFVLSSGCGFGNSGYDYDYTGTRVGSRLCFKSKELSDYVGNQFLGLYKDFLTI